MKIATKPFAKALEIAADVIERRNTIPILGSAKVEHRAENDRLIVTGTDLDMIVQVSAPYRGAAFSPFTVAGPKAMARLFRAGGEDLELDDQDGKISFGSGPMSGSLATLPADDFPILGYSTEGMFQTSLGAEQIDMILRVAGAVSTEETRYYLNGVYLHHVQDWTWKAVATDGHRLYVGTLELPDWQGEGIGAHGGGHASGGVIIPRRFLNLLRLHRPRMNLAGEIQIFAGRAGPPTNRVKDLAPDTAKYVDAACRFGIRFFNGDTDVQIVTKLIDGTFPDYTRVIPQEAPDDKRIMFKAADMRRAIDAITAGASERTRAIKLTFDPKGKCAVSCKWVDLGFEGKIEIPATVRHGQKELFEVGYNSSYLRQICDVAGGEDLSITLHDSNAPGTLASPGSTDFLTVLMPMRV